MILANSISKFFRPSLGLLKGQWLSSLLPNVKEEIVEMLSPEQVSDNQAILDAHGKDESFRKPLSPNLVIYPKTTDQISKVLKLCNETRTAVVPFGAGTSVEGHIACLRGGVSIDLSRMNNILEVCEEDFCCRVEAGVTKDQLNDSLKNTGLFFSVDPGATATLGGMMATRASGTNTVRFGTMRENVLGCTAVLANGIVIKTGSKAVKSSAGYDLTHLLCGSEGTLAVITELTVKLRPHPESVAAAVCEFPSVKAAVECAAAVIQTGINVARMELMDEVAIESINKYSKLDLKAAPTLFFDFHGTEASLREQAETVSEISRNFRRSEFRWETTTEGRTKLWKARHSCFYALKQLRPGFEGISTDVCVPISRLAESITNAARLIKDESLFGPIIGHVGDGNFHVVVMVDPNDEAEIKKLYRVSDQIVKQALRVGGTCTGEHGIGYGKLSYLREEHGDGAVDVMHSIKAALDPHNILNPGKLGSLM